MAELKSLTINGKSIFDLIYPVGSVYETENSGFNPNTSFTGTWERIEGKTLVGVSDTDTDFASPAKTGGEKTHKLSNAELPQISGNMVFHGQENGTNVYSIGGCFTGIKQTGKYRTGSVTNGAFSYSSVGISIGGGAVTTTCLRIIRYIFGDGQHNKTFLLQEGGR